MNASVTTARLGWIGMGRMGTPMATRLAKAGHPLAVYNRTKAKALPLKDYGAGIVDLPAELADRDIVFSMLSTSDDLKQVIGGADGLLSRPGKAPKIFVDCSSIGEEASAEIRATLAAAGCQFLAAPVSGNGKCVKAGKISMVASGPRDAFEAARPFLDVIAGRGVSYVGEGELARIVKICHNLMLGVVTQNLAEITILAQKAGVSRHAFLDFMNKSVMGSVFTRYKTPALVNLDFTTTFTPALLKKDLDLGLAAARRLGVPMPVTAATREVLQAHIGHASGLGDGYLEKDFATLLAFEATLSGLALASENVALGDGLEAETVPNPSQLVTTSNG
jgi:3-hydroxyisobutyrate dehydrogenase